MSTRQPRKIRRNAAEQLLGGPAGPGAGPEQLARVLAAAAAPGRESELAGEEAAVAAFRAHHLVPVTASRRGQMIKSPLAKLLTAKVLAVCVAVFATGGVALAASDGALSSSQTPRGHGGVSRPASHRKTSGANFFAEAERKGLEGIMAKRADSDYRSGVRTMNG